MTVSKEKLLRQIIRDSGKIVVAFSGGVDSALLAKIAVDETVHPIAVTADSVFLPQAEREDASVIAKQLGIEQHFLSLDPLSLDNVRTNPKDRCYHCKKSIYTELLRFTRSKGYDAVLDGGNFSDLADYRPGSIAVKELGIRSPLAEAEFTKDEVRALSEKLGIPGFNRPAAACLASRIPYGEEITVKDLHIVDQAENIIRGFGYTKVRVRLLGRIACIELSQDELSSPDLLGKYCQPMVDQLSALGFERVVLDLAGYRTSSLNKSIP